MYVSMRYNMKKKLLKRLRDKKELKLLDVLAEQYKKDDKVCFYELARLIIDGDVKTGYPHKNYITKHQKIQKLDHVTLGRLLYQDYERNLDGGKRNVPALGFGLNDELFDTPLPAPIHIETENLYYTTEAEKYLYELSTRALHFWVVFLAVISTSVGIIGLFNIAN